MSDIIKLRVIFFCYICQFNANSIVNMNKELIVKELRNILNRSKIVHKNKILCLSTIKEAHIYCKINSLSGQLSGPLIEEFIQKKYNMIKNSASLCTGDLRHNNTDLEIKASNGGKDNNKFNFVQIRMNHTCEYLFTAYYINNYNIDNLGELYMFKLTKDEIKNIIFHHGSYAHGTIKKNGPITHGDLDNPNNIKEYALRPKYDGDCWNILLKFRIYEDDL